MKTRDLYRSIRASVIRFCADIGEEVSADIIPYDFDKTSVEENLPASDLIGPMELYMDSRQSTKMIGFKLTVSTLNDTDLDKLERTIGEVVDTLETSPSFPIRNHTTGDIMGTLALTRDYMVEPVGTFPSKTRAIQTVNVVCLSTLT